MTAFAVMRLAEKGLLDIDEPVASYIPGFALWDEASSRQVTLRDMLCHRTGVGGHDGAWPDNSISRVDYLKRLKYLEPNAPFRSLAQYSNVMYAAIGGIMEAVSGKKWETLLREEIFEPLGMDRTFCLMDEAASDENCAMPFRWNRGLHEIPRWNIDQAGPCGSVMSSAEDMVKWISLHMEGGKKEGAYLLSPSDFMEMHRPQILMDYPHVRGGRSLGYGFGWRVMEYHGALVQQHTGKIEGYSAFQFYIPSLSSGAVYLQNLHAPDNPLILPCRDSCWMPSLGGKRRTGMACTRKKENPMPPRICTIIWSLTVCRRAAPGGLCPMRRRITGAPISIPATAPSG